MESTIDKKKIARAIDKLPEQTTVEQAIERLIVLRKIEKGLHQSEAVPQTEAEEHFKKRREQRTD